MESLYCVEIHDVDCDESKLPEPEIRSAETGLSSGAIERRTESWTEGIAGLSEGVA